MNLTKHVDDINTETANSSDDDTKESKQKALTLLETTISKSNYF